MTTGVACALTEAEAAVRVSEGRYLRGKLVFEVRRSTAV